MEDEAMHVSMADPQLALAEERSHTRQAVEDDVINRRRWKRSLALNLIGAIATAVVLVVFVVTKFLHGAWLVVLIIPLLVLMFRAIHKHYVKVSSQLATFGTEYLRPIKHEVIVPISGLHQGVLLALQYAKSIAPDHVTAVFVDLDGESGSRMTAAWEKWNLGVPLEILNSPYRSLSHPLMEYIEQVDRKRDDDLLTVVLPEFVPAKWWHQLLHNQSSLLLKGRLLFRRGIIVTNIPYHLKE